MPTKDNWFQPNIKQRLIDPYVPFDVNIKNSDVEDINFEEAVKKTIASLNDLGKRIYVSFSGGLDSEYMVKSFMKSGVKFTPLIVRSPANIIESKFAIDFCNDNFLSSTIIDVSENEIISIFYDKIYNSLNSIGINSTIPLIAAHIAAENNSILVVGEHIIDEIDDKISIGVNEWDFYNEAYYSNTYYFYLHTPQIVYSILKKINTKCAQDFKSSLYQIPNRAKIKYEYSEPIQNIYNQLKNNREMYPPSKVSFKTRSKFIKKYFNIKSDNSNV